AGRLPVPPCGGRAVPEPGSSLAGGGRRGPAHRHRPRRRGGTLAAQAQGLAHHRPGRSLQRGVRHAAGGVSARRGHRSTGTAGHPGTNPATTRPPHPRATMSASQAVAPTPPGDATKPAARPLTVLLVDDQAIIGESVRRMLAAETDIGFHFCQDPTQAIATANRVQPTVILQDLVMPEIDGLQLVKFFRANAATRETPMVVLSSKEEPVIKAQAFALGANDYLVKLPDKVELIARVRYHSRAYLNL